MNVPIFFYLTDIVILFVGIPQGQSTLIPNLPPLKHQKGVRVH